MVLMPSYLEELVEEESEPISQHLLGHRLRPGHRRGGRKRTRGDWSEAMGWAELGRTCQCLTDFSVW